MSISESLKLIIKIFNKPFNEKGVVKKEEPLSQSHNVIESEKLDKKYTLVLDLDETLVHYQEKDSEGQILFRPYLEEFLEGVSYYYEIYVFTASLQQYADFILNHLDPDKNLFIYRFYRQDLTSHPFGEVKDLQILGKDLSKVIIIDNLEENFRA